MIAISNAPITPGPWDVSINKAQDTYNIRGYHGRIVAHAYLGANARLIASAPDLLVALELCIEAIAGESAPDILMNSIERQAVDAARAAIAKARGG